ncbi:hypothetical protein L9F63_017067, partial [Diploptera punctata]
SNRWDVMEHTTYLYNNASQVNIYIKRRGKKSSNECMYKDRKTSGNMTEETQNTPNSVKSLLRCPIGTQSWTNRSLDPNEMFLLS